MNLNRFNRQNVIYKITQDIDLQGATLTIPVGCTLDFQGGTFRNGVIIFNNTSVKSSDYRIFYDITIQGTLLNSINATWLGVTPANADNSAMLSILSLDETPISIFFPRGTYKFAGSLTLNNYKKLIGEDKDNTVLQYTGNGNFINVGSQNMEEFTNATGSRTYYLQISNMSIQATNTAANFLYGGVAESLFSDLKFSGWGKVLYLNNSWSNTFNNIVVKNCTTVGSVGQEFNNAVFQSCMFNSCEYGFTDIMGQSILFNGCSFQAFTTCVFVPILDRVPDSYLRLEAFNLIGCYVETSNRFFDLYNYEFFLKGFNIIGNTINLTRTTEPAFRIYNKGIRPPTGAIMNNKFRIYGEGRQPLVQITGYSDIAVIFNDSTAGFVTTTGESPNPLVDVTAAQEEHSMITGEVKTIQINQNPLSIAGKLPVGAEVYDNGNAGGRPAYLWKQGLVEILRINIIGNATQNGDIIINAGGKTYTIPITSGMTPEQSRQALFAAYYDDYLPSLNPSDTYVWLSAKEVGPKAAASISNTCGVTTEILLNRAGTNNSWVDVYGHTYSVIRGTTEQRPTLNNNNDYGYEYFDATVGIPIYWKGSLWVRSDGTDVSKPNKGNTASRPTGLAFNDRGFQYYDTDLSKLILWQGTKWVNTDSTNA